MEKTYTFEEEPRNVLVHQHSASEYAWALAPNGDLVRRNTMRIGEHFVSNWRNCEIVRPQTKVKVDPETGEQFPPDPTREAYIAALLTMLETTEMQSNPR